MRAFNERASINAPIQGSAADIIRRAMIRMERHSPPPAVGAHAAAGARRTDLRGRGRGRRDDPVVDTVMENARHAGACAMKVPLKVDARHIRRDNWDEAH
jgi:DNA polymerase-1